MDNASLQILCKMKTTVDQHPLIIEEPVNPSTTLKRVAAEDITNTAKRRRAPCAIQPSVAQVFEDFGPKYRTRRRAIVHGVSSESAEKENEPQATQTSLRLQGRN